MYKCQGKPTTTNIASATTVRGANQRNSATPGWLQIEKIPFKAPRTCGYGSIHSNPAGKARSALTPSEAGDREGLGGIL